MKFKTVLIVAAINVVLIVADQLYANLFGPVKFIKKETRKIFAQKQLDIKNVIYVSGNISGIADGFYSCYFIITDSLNIDECTIGCYYSKDTAYIIEIARDRDIIPLYLNRAE